MCKSLPSPLPTPHRRNRRRIRRAPQPRRATSRPPHSASFATPPLAAQLAKKIQRQKSHAVLLKLKFKFHNNVLSNYHQVINMKRITLIYLVTFLGLMTSTCIIVKAQESTEEGKL